MGSEAWAMQVARRRGMKRAVIALARKLATVLHRMWVDGTEFGWTREAPVAPVAACSRPAERVVSNRAD